MCWTLSSLDLGSLFYDILKEFTTLQYSFPFSEISVYLQLRSDPRSSSYGIESEQ